MGDFVDGTIAVGVDFIVDVDFMGGFVDGTLALGVVFNLFFFFSRLRFLFCKFFCCFCFFCFGVNFFCLIPFPPDIFFSVFVLKLNGFFFLKLFLLIGRDLRYIFLL